MAPLYNKIVTIALVSFGGNLRFIFCSLLVVARSEVAELLFHELDGSVGGAGV